MQIKYGHYIKTIISFICLFSILHLNQEMLHYTLLFSKQNAKEKINSLDNILYFTVLWKKGRRMTTNNNKGYYYYYYYNEDIIIIDLIVSKPVPSTWHITSFNNQLFHRGQFHSQFIPHNNSSIIHNNDKDWRSQKCF